MNNFLTINANALEACQTLYNAGYQSFIVGGCIRDLLLNLTPKDYDITTNARPEVLMELFPKHYLTGLKHGTITVNVNDELFEITTFRIDGKYEDGRRPEEVFYANSIQEDLSRRDFTINAIAYDPISFQLEDPFNGLNDLENKIIKTVGLANDRFNEDGLRIMRAARFASRFEYKIVEETLSAMSSNLLVLRKVSKERIKDEICKILSYNNPSYGFHLLDQTGALKIISPLLTSNESNLHYISHLDDCFGEVETKLAFLYANCASIKVKEELIDLKFSNKEIKKVIFLLDLLDKYNIFSSKDTSFAYKSFMAIIKNHSPDDWRSALKQFKYLAEAMGLQPSLLLNKYKNEIVFSKKDLLIDGNDLLQLGFEGPAIKKALDDCYLEILKNPQNNNLEFLFIFIKNLSSS